MDAPALGPRKGHRKSRHGCICCKSRKVKCDEAKPSCGNCTRFRIPCQFPATGRVAAAAIAAATEAPKNDGTQETVLRLPLPPQLSSLRERGRGRPRRDWAALFPSTNHCIRAPRPTISPTAPISPINPISSISSIRSISPVSPVAIDVTAAPDLPPNARIRQPTQDLALNTAQAELLHHFVLFAGPSLAGTERPDDPIALFWSRNAPRLGLATPSILYLALSLSAYHLLHLGIRDERVRCRYRSLAELYNARGLAELNEELPSINDQNCGPLYVAAVLLCFNSFAVGPTGSSDLLICDTIGGTPGRWVSLATGVRLIRMSFHPSALFSGLLKPLGDSSGPTQDSDPAEDSLPTCAAEGYRRVDWVSHLANLRDFVESGPAGSSEDTNTCLSALQGVRNIYDATYGNECGLYTGSPVWKMVLIWLYLMDNAYVKLVRNKDIKALLVLAYYAPLLKTMRRSWFMGGWSKHIINLVHVLVHQQYKHWLEWPANVEKSIKFDIV